jgi:hypothetical protein
MKFLLVTIFRDHIAAILTLKTRAESRLWPWNHLQKATSDTYILEDFSALRDGWKLE